MIPTGRHRVLQIHPTLRCNLACEHCYSFSGPSRKEALDSQLLSRATHDASAQGYNVVAFSGGEPLLYPELSTVLDAARQAGMHTVLTTNGMLLDERWLGGVAEHLDLLAISVDGMPHEHDRIRACTGAFEQLVRGLDYVRTLGVPFGFIVTLTRETVRQLPWLANFAVEQGAALLQLHPLELAGRAAERLAGLEPDHLDLGAAFAQVLELQSQYQGQLYLQLDAASQKAVENQVVSSPQALPTELAGLVSPLVIEADGVVVPLQYGFPRDLVLGDLHEQPLDELAPQWIAGHGQRFQSILAGTRDQRWWPDQVPMANWYELAARVAAEGTPTS